MRRLKTMLLAATVVGAGLGGLAMAQSGQPTYDPAQLPETRGKVSAYALTPRGDVDGLILDDGTEVFLGPRQSGALIYTVRPGDAVTIHGLKARAQPLVMAMSVTNDATKATVLGGGPRGAEEADRAPGEVSGTVKQALHGPRGDVNGVLLTDGTQVRLPPPEAAKLGDALAAGKTVVVRGPVLGGVLGKLVMAREIGPDAQHLTRIELPFLGGPMERMMHGMMGHHPHGPGRDAADAGPKDHGPGGPGGPGGEPDDEPPAR